MRNYANHQDIAAGWAYKEGITNKEYCSENTKSDRIDWPYPCYLGFFIGIDQAVAPVLWIDVIDQIQIEGNARRPPFVFTPGMIGNRC